MDSPGWTRYSLSRASGSRSSVARGSWWSTCSREDCRSAACRPRPATESDAFVPADTLRHEHTHWRPLPVLTERTAELEAVTRDREGILWPQRSVESQLRAVLETYHPAGAFRTRRAGGSRYSTG